MEPGFVDGPLSSLSALSREMGFALHVFCLHNIAQEAYAYMIHLALHYDSFAEYTGFFHVRLPSVWFFFIS